MVARKEWWQSKTMWFAVIQVLSGAGYQLWSLATEAGWVPPAVLVTALGFVGAALRIVTTAPVRMPGGGGVS